MIQICCLSLGICKQSRRNSTAMVNCFWESQMKDFLHSYKPVLQRGAVMDSACVGAGEIHKISSLFTEHCHRWSWRPGCCPLPSGNQMPSFFFLINFQLSVHIRNTPNWCYFFKKIHLFLCVCKHVAHNTSPPQRHKCSSSCHFKALSQNREFSRIGTCLQGTAS